MPCAKTKPTFVGMTTRYKDSICAVMNRIEYNLDAYPARAHYRDDINAFRYLKPFAIIADDVFDSATACEDNYLQLWFFECLTFYYFLFYWHFILLIPKSIS